MLIGVGRRKQSVAKVQIYLEQVGKMEINNVPYDQYLQGNTFAISSLSRLFEFLGITPVPKVYVIVKGGGITGQAQACHLAISRALEKASYRQALKSKGFLRQDSRQKERRKYGLKKARKAPQFSKR